MLGANFKKSVSRITNWGHERPRRESKQGCSWLLSSCLERISSLIWGLNQRRAQSWAEGSWAQHVHFAQVARVSTGGGSRRARSLPGLHPHPPRLAPAAAGTAFPHPGPGLPPRLGTGVGTARGWARPGAVLSRCPSFTSRQGRKKPPARDRRGGRDGGLTERNLSLQWSASSRFC